MHCFSSNATETLTNKRGVSGNYDYSDKSLYFYLRQITIFTLFVIGNFHDYLHTLFVIFCRFQRRYNLPGVIGCIDCTHISIVKPSNNEHLYFNRKGYHSLNIQMVSKENLPKPIFFSFTVLI